MTGTITLNNIPRAITDGEIILATADITLSPGEIFRALNTRELEDWWGEEGVYRMTKWYSDLRVGGPWHVVTLLPEEQAHPAGGEFLEIDEPYKVVFTRAYEWDYPELGHKQTIVTYLAQPLSEGTRLTIRHEGFKGFTEAAEMHAEGWERVLRWLILHAKNRNSLKKHLL